MSTPAAIAEPAAPRAADHLQLVVFSLGPDEYGVPIGTVQEIIRHAPPRPLPGSGHGVEGLINLRGSVIPVIDLRAHLPASGERPGSGTVVIAGLPTGTVGLQVDEVREVILVDVAVIEEPPRGGRGGRAGVSGIAKLGDRLLVIIDLAGLLGGDGPD